VAYVKIMEGCNRHCTYCIIPALRGKLRSRPPEDIIGEVAALAENGFPEIVIIGQDTTSYGDDLGGGVDLAGLLAACAVTAPRSWIRFLYGHPDRIDDALLDTVRSHSNICRYFDIPIQHVSTSVLTRMGRGRHDEKFLDALFSRIRTAMPDAALRTTVMTGFPGETEKDFRQLCDFIQKTGFDHLGAFVYSDADDLASHRLAGHIPTKTAEGRMNRLMSMQAEISLAKNENRIGREYMVLVEENQEAASFIGRTTFQAPEVDGITVIYSTDCTIGEFLNVRITDATEYDLEGVPA
jgi:ribosomal protein S12 methylthiotransferase